MIPHPKISQRLVSISIRALSVSSMETAEQCRQRGNELLQRGDFADAAQQYDQGLVALLPCQAGDEATPRAGWFGKSEHTMDDGGTPMTKPS